MRRGMTLIEVLISTAIFSFVIVAIFMTFRLGTRYWLHIRAQKTLQDSLRFASEDIYKEVKRSSLDLIRFIDVNYSSSGTLESNLERDVLILISSKNWYNGQAYDDKGNPLWNRVIVYWPTPVLAEPSKPLYGGPLSNLPLNLSITKMQEIDQLVYGKLFKIIVDFTPNDSSSVGLDKESANDLANTLESNLSAYLGSLTSCSGSSSDSCISSMLSGIEVKLQDIVSSKANSSKPKSKMLVPPPHSESLGNALFSFSVSKPADSSEVIIKIDLRKTIPEKRRLLGKSFFRAESTEITLKVTPKN